MKNVLTCNAKVIEPNHSLTTNDILKTTLKKRTFFAKLLWIILRKIVICAFSTHTEENHLSYKYIKVLPTHFTHR